MAHSSASYDVIVIGLGAMGAATLYQLAQRKVRVRGFDQFTPPHALGSSHGETRITRLAIGEGDCYSPFAIRSHEIWRDLERMTNERLLHITGGLVIGNSDHSGRFHGKPSFLETTMRAAKRWGIQHEILDAQETRRRFSQFLLSDSEGAYFEPEAGYVAPEACVRAQVEAARRYGAEIALNDKVIEIQPRSSGGVTVRADSGIYNADQVVLAIGSWISRFLPTYARHFSITRQVLYWFSCPQASHRFGRGKSPVFLWALGDEEAEGLYGFPAIDGDGGGVKIAPSKYDREVDPDSVDRSVGLEEIEKVYNRYVRGRIQFVEPRCVKTATCLYTTTPDSDFVIDRLPETPQLVVVSPCSGHGFKHSAAIGESVAELVTTGSSSRDLRPFSLSRFSL